MRTIGLVWLASSFLPFACQAAAFYAVELKNEGTRLVITQTDSTQTEAPLLDNQDGFDRPRIAPGQRSVGWLALYPNHGASYSQALELVVLDDAWQLHRFAGDFGTVLAWCFTVRGDAVVFKHQFPHGPTPVTFDMRRVSDGQLLQRATLKSAGPDEDDEAIVRNRAPKWTSCARGETGVR